MKGIRTLAAKYVIAEMKNNILGFIKSFALFTFILTLIACCVFCASIPYINETIFLNNSDYEWIGYSGERLPRAGFRTIKTDAVTDFAYDGAGVGFVFRITLDLYIVEDIVEVPGSYFCERNFQAGRLEDVQVMPNSIALSCNAAHLLRLGVGDTCFLLDERFNPLPLTVAAILKTKYGDGEGITSRSGVGLVFPSEPLTGFLGGFEETLAYAVFGNGTANSGKFETVTFKKDQLAAASIVKNTLQSARSFGVDVFSLLGITALMLSVSFAVGCRVKNRARNIGVLRIQGVTKQTLARAFIVEQVVLLTPSSVAAGYISGFILTAAFGYVITMTLLLIIAVNLAISLFSLALVRLQLNIALGKAPVRILDTEQV